MLQSCKQFIIYYNLIFINYLEAGTYNVGFGVVDLTCEVVFEAGDMKDTLTSIQVYDWLWVQIIKTDFTLCILNFFFSCLFNFFKVRDLLMIIRIILLLEGYWLLNDKWVLLINFMQVTLQKCFNRILVLLLNCRFLCRLLKQALSDLIFDTFRWLIGSLSLNFMRLSELNTRWHFQWLLHRWHLNLLSLSLLWLLNQLKLRVYHLHERQLWKL